MAKSVRARKQNGGWQGLGVGQGSVGELLFDGYRGFQDEKGSGDCLYNYVNVINTSELYI